jgi:DNA-binding transcriptional LysR family regulator
MSRNLDLTALRSFVTVAEVGGVTRAAGFLHLTQSAVSMQIKRLEEALGRDLFERLGRGVVLTANGEQLLGYARRMLALNDEALARLTDQAFEGEIVLGVPHDIVYPAIPQVLQRFHAAYPRMKVNLVSSYTSTVKAMFQRGECDVILTTEDRCDPGGETLRSMPLVWVGAPGGQAWKARPLRLAFEYKSLFRAQVESVLDAADIPWEMAVESESSRTVEASVSADLTVHALLEGTIGQMMERIPHGGSLPELPRIEVNLYAADAQRGQAAGELLTLIRQTFATL